MSATFDSTTKAAYDAATTAQARAEAIVASLTGTISVKVFNGSNTEMGSGTMADPWATAVAGAVVLGEVSSFTVGTTATPDSDWYIRFQNADVSRWARGSFGLSGADYNWSLATWEAGQTGTIGTATIVATGNAAPVFTVAPTSASIAATGGTIQFTAADPDGGSVFYSLTTTRAGITIDSAGLVTVTAAATGTSGNIVVQASDGILTASATCAVTVAEATEATYTIPALTSSRTFDGGSASGWSSFGPSRAPQGGDIIELAAGTHGPITFRNLLGGPGSRITVRNGSGQVTIRRSSASSGGFVLTLDDCQYVTVDGSNGGLDYGIKVTSPSATDAPSSYVKCEDFCNDITLRHFEVDGLRTTWTSAGTPIGVQLHDNNVLQSSNPGVFQHDLLVEYAYLHNLGGEGIYAGPNFSTGAIPIKDITIRYCTVTDCGRDGIQAKCTWEGANAIHGNTVTRCGRNSADPQAGQLFGISINSGMADIYDNLISESGESGIQVYTHNGPTASVTFNGYGPYTSFGCRIYNNVVVDSGQASTSNSLTGAGITMGAGSSAYVKPQPYVYNNTCVDNEGAGVSIGECAAGWVRNNVLIGNGATYSLGSGGTTQRDNKTTGTLTVDYRLTSEDAAVGTLGTDIAATDIEGASRGGTASKGAYEYT